MAPLRVVPRAPTRHVVTSWVNDDWTQQGIRPRRGSLGWHGGAPGTYGDDLVLKSASALRIPPDSLAAD
ncbi:hypothetical protein PCANC_22401 [Puccinia coronata f. sp. avenae]|uniref:Uncharacterized protein n=1 Tax=Puccinia coronata f. sp. avenae TaxID=200324 RepID=A0A2N5TKM9_9BASI|nr:hypothetical protein PCANC_22401 [Puccinia coronata f. sp. avenae]PLW38708.1 hypothetical protein PCASD_11537 [Puccinia coronata f. sp. avenae]